MEKNKKKIVITIGVVCIAFISIFTYKHINKAPSNTIEQLEILNVEENESIKASKEAIIDGDKFAHISLDDFIMAFEDITNNMDKYTSIFENDTFAYLKNLHDNYGAVISCYTYYESDDKKFNLSKCTDKFAEEYIGKMIGDESALRIILHAKAKEEVKIRLAQIQKAIDEQKAQIHE